MGGNRRHLYSLGDLTENLDFRRVPVKEADRKKGQYPYYGASGIIDMIDDYLFDGEYLLVAEDGENLRSRKTPIAFMATGRFWVNNHAHIVRGNERANTKFLMYYLRQVDISGFLTGSTLPKLTQQNLNRIQIYAPSLSEQELIAGFLGVLDDKIELNRRMNRTLESIARAVFRQWFIENQDAANWDLKTLGDVFSTLETGSRPKGGVSPEPVGVPSVGAESIVRIGHFDFSKTKYVPIEYFESMRRGHVEDRDVLLYKDGGRPGEFEPHVSMFGDGFPFGKFSINEHVYRMRVTPPLTQAYLYFWLESDEIMEEMRNRGTGVAVPGLNSTALSGINIVLPPHELLKEFSELVEPLISRIFANAKESRTLASLRDTLLPKLMRGEVRVKEIEKKL